MARRKKHSLNLLPGLFGFNGGGGIDLGTSVGVPFGLVWWDAETPLDLSGVTVLNWRDRKTSSSATPNLAANRPTRSETGFNGAPGVVFDGVDDECTLSVLPSFIPKAAEPFEVWAVISQDALPADTANRNLIALGGSATGTFLSIARVVVSSVNRLRVIVGNGVASTQLIDTTVDFSGRHYVRVQVTATQFIVWIDGIALAPVANVPNIGTTRLRLGASSAGTATAFWKGVIRDIVIARPLSDGQAQKQDAWATARRGELGTAKAYTDPLDYGAVYDGVTDDSLAVQSAIAAAAATGKFCRLGAGNIGWASDISIPANSDVRGEGGTTKFVVLADALAMRPRGDNIKLDNFSIESGRTVASSTTGFINCDSTTLGSANLNIKRIGLNAPNHGKNLVTLRGQPSGLISGVDISLLAITAGGRMGVEVLTAAGGSVSGFSIHHSNINNVSMGVSLSGTISSAKVDQNSFNNCAYAYVELVGETSGVEVTLNNFDGASTNGVISSNASLQTGTLVKGNICQPTAKGSWLFASCPGAEITDNIIYGGTVRLKSNSIKFQRNTVRSTGTSATLVDNAANCIVDSNDLSNFDAASNFAVMRAFGAAATGNQFTNNKLRQGPGGVLFDESTGASGNTFSGNYL